MADKLDFELRPDSITSGETSTLKLAVTHSHEAPLHSFNMRVKGSGAVRVTGGSRLQFTQLESQETYLVDLPVRAKQPGSGEILLDRLSACLGGRTLEFPDVTIPVEVLPPGAFPVQALSLLCDPIYLQENVQTDLRLRFRNDSRFSLKEVLLRPQEGSVEILSGAEIGFGDVGPSQEAGLKLPVKPRQAGDLTLVVYLNGQASGKPVKQAFELNFTVKPDARAQETHTHVHGDILQVGKGHVIGNISSSTLSQAQPKRNPMDNNAEVPSFNHSIEVGVRSCPSCGEEVPSGRFCDRCRHDFRSEK